MGSGCICQNSGSRNSPSARSRIVRAGNLTYKIYGNVKIENKTVGKGCKRTPMWETLSTKEDVKKKIEEFWDTRIEGNPNVWKTLRAACEEPSLLIAEQIIKSAGISMLSGVLMLTFDEIGYRYDLPVYVINEAAKYGSEKVAPKLPEDYQGEDINVVIRCVRFNDSKIIVNTRETVEKIKEKFRDANKIQDQRIRLFFNGKELLNNTNLYHAKVKEGLVIQAHVS